MVLNTITTPFEWSIPYVSSNIGVPSSLTAHTADLVGDYMIVAFGKRILSLCNNLKKDCNC